MIEKAFNLQFKDSSSGQKWPKSNQLTKVCLKSWLTIYKAFD